MVESSLIFALEHPFSYYCLLTQNPGLLAVRPVVDLLLGEPMLDLMLGTFSRIRSVANIPANSQAQVSSDGSREGVIRASSSQQVPSTLDDVGTLPDHGNHRARGEVGDQTIEKRLHFG